MQQVSGHTSPCHRLLHWWQTVSVLRCWLLLFVWAGAVWHSGKTDIRSRAFPRCVSASGFDKSSNLLLETNLFRALDATLSELQAAAGTQLNYLQYKDASLFIEPPHCPQLFWHAHVCCVKIPISSLVVCGLLVRCTWASHSSLIPNTVYKSHVPHLQDIKEIKE